MDGTSYGEAVVGLALGSAIVWGPIFGFAYSRRQSGGLARNYLTAFAVAWLATMAFFVLLTVWEH